MLAGMGTTIADLSLEEILQPEQLRELGYGDSRPSRGGLGTDWVRIARSCYVRARRWQELSPRQQCLAMHLAFLSRTTAPWVFSDASAALLHGLPLLRLPDRVHVSSVRKPSTRDPQVVVHHRPGIGAHRSLLGGQIPVTDLPRTLLDCAASMGFEDGVVLADHVLRVGVGSEDVLGLLQAAPGFRGARRVRRVLDFADARSESALESLARVAVHELRLPAPRPQMPVRTRAVSDAWTWDGSRCAWDWSLMARPSTSTTGTPGPSCTRSGSGSWTSRRQGWCCCAPGGPMCGVVGPS